MDLFDALQGNLRDHLEPPWSEILLVFASFVCGAIVGVERERADKPAGLRTMMLICAGSAIFTLASVSPVLGRPEPGRVAAQIVTGVGFLGAGAILRERRGISGMTTAASIWATAGIGMVVGAGYAVPALALSFGVLLTLSVVGRLESVIAGPCRHERAIVVYRAAHGKTRIRIQDAIDSAKGVVKVAPLRVRDDETLELPIEVCRTHREHRALLALLAEIPSVDEVRDADVPIVSAPSPQ